MKNQSVHSPKWDNEYPRPRILLIGVPPVQAEALVKEFSEDPFECVIVHDPVKELIDACAAPECFAVVINDHHVNSPLDFIKNIKKFGPGKCFLFSAKNSVSFRSRAMTECGAEEVLDHPVMASKVSGRIRGLFLQSKAEYLGRFPDIAARKRLGVEVPDAGIIQVKANPMYIEARSWPRVDEKTIQEISHKSGELSHHFQDVLARLHSDIGNEGRISFASFGVETSLIEETPSAFVVIQSTGHVPSSDAPVAVNRYPEMLRCFRERIPVFGQNLGMAPEFRNYRDQIASAGAKSVAVLPLSLGEKIFGVLKLRFPQESSHELQSFVTDLAGYAQELSFFASRIDYFSRIYRRMKSDKESLDRFLSDNPDEIWKAS